MKSIIYFFILYIVFLSYSCNNNRIEVTTKTINDNTSKDKTICYSVSNQTYKATKKYDLKVLHNLYTIIDTSKMDNKMFLYIDANYTNKLMFAMLYDEDIVKEITLLFFLKLHVEHIKHKHGYNAGCCLNKFICLTLFSMKFFQMSDIDPVSELFMTERVYKWVKKDKTYLKNTRINSLVSEIDSYYQTNI